MPIKKVKIAVSVGSTPRRTMRAVCYAVWALLIDHCVQPASKARALDFSLDTPYKVAQSFAPYDAFYGPMRMLLRAASKRIVDLYVRVK